MPMSGAAMPDDEFLAHALEVVKEIGHEAEFRRKGLRLLVRPGESPAEVEERWRGLIEEQARSKDLAEELRRLKEGHPARILPRHPEPITFPCSVVPIPEYAVELRDRFAGQAMAALIGVAGLIDPRASIHNVKLAEIAYGVADAMLRAREGG